MEGDRNMVKKYAIVLNADVGEEAGFDKEIMPCISWCNIACGMHAGNDDEIKKTIALAHQHGVKIGAHPSYPDRENFGRISMNILKEQLVDTLTMQIQNFQKIAKEFGVKMHHIKPHGALYNDAVNNHEIAEVILSVVENVDKSSILIVPPKSIIADLAIDRVEVKYETFADRNYNNDLTLVSRKLYNAVLKNPEDVYTHVHRMITENKIKTNKGTLLKVPIDTICVHGDNPEAVAILKYVTTKLESENIIIE